MTMNIGTPWKRVAGFPFSCAILLMSGIAYVHLTHPEGWVRVLDDANLVFHEAGHPLFSWFGATLEIWGGTLGQLAFPLGTAIYFGAQRQTIAFALCAAWFFENFWNIARYIADARAQVLPLVGGGEHDWATILAPWHLTQYDTRIAQLVALLGWIGFVGIAIWLLNQYLSNSRIEN